MRPSAAPEAASISITMSPCLAAAGGALVADVVRDVAARGGHLLDQVEGLLLELAALAGAALALGRQLEPRPRARRAAASPRPRAGRSSRPAARARRRTLHLVTTEALKSASGLCPSSAENWRSSSWRESLSDFADQLLHLVLHGGVAVEPEVPRDQLGELLGLGVERLRHRAAVLADETLELLHEPLLDRPRPIREGALGLRGRMLELVANRLADSTQSRLPAAPRTRGEAGLRANCAGPWRRPHDPGAVGRRPISVPARTPTDTAERNQVPRISSGSDTAVRRVL